MRQDVRLGGRNRVHLHRATADLFSITDGRKRGTGPGGEMSDRGVQGGCKEGRGGNEGGERKKIEREAAGLKTAGKKQHERRKS